MIYLDTSVCLAWLLGEDRHPPAEIWRATIVSSRLLEYETLVRLHSQGVVETHGAAAREVLSRVAFVDLEARVLRRALEAFPIPVRPLDALHLATAHFLVGQNQPIELASYDDRMNEAAARMGIPLSKRH